jgi:hypothetical protein
MSEPAKVNKGIKSPALGNEDYLKNSGGMVRTLKVDAISKECRPPKTSPKGIVGKSVRV